MKKFIGYIGGFFVLLLLVLEVFFRVVIPGPELPVAAFNPTYSLFSNQTEPAQGLYTYGKLAEIQATWHINQQGWNAAKDFLPAEKRSNPAIVILGDSYIENLYQAPDQHMEVHIEQALTQPHEVYGIGKRGTPLSHFAAFAAYAQAHIAPAYTLVLVNHLGVPESFADYRKMPQARQYKLDKSEVISIPAKPKSSSTLKDLLAKSRLYTYLRTNFALQLTPPRDPFFQPPTPEIVQQDSVRLSKQLELVHTQFLEDMSVAAGRSKVLYILHPYRTSIYAGDTPVQQSRWLQLFKQVLEQQGAAYLDLNVHFQEVYQREGKRFEYDINNHFNEYGTKVAAEGIAQWLNEMMVD